MGLRVVSEVVEEERKPLKLAMEADKPVPPKPAFDARLLPVLQAISAVLAVRVILALVGLGGFVLAIISALMPSWGSLTAAGIYDVAVLLPFVAYAAFRRN
jgi:hypothetical protein